MLCAGWNDEGIAIADFRLHAVDMNFTLAILDTEELVPVPMRLEADILAGLERHQYELKIVACIEHVAEVRVVLRQLLDIGDKSLHGGSFQFIGVSDL